MEHTDLPEISSGADIRKESEKPAILVIDDELGPRESLRILLQDFYSVYLAKDGYEGISMLSSGDYDVVILDLRMPEKSGLETLEEIRKINPEIPVIILTGFGTLESAQRAVHLNIFEFISKPFDVNEMKEIVKRAVEKNKINRSTKVILNQLRKLNTDLEDRIHELEKFAVVGKLSAEMLHEINNPLTVILGYVQILLHEITNKNQASAEEIQRYLTVVESEVKRCQTIARSFLDVSKKSYKHTPININTILENMVYFFKENPMAKNIEFSFNFAADISLIFGSPEQLQQVFINLFMNAIEAIDSRGKISIETKNQPGKVVVRISDNGRGIPPEILGKIFKPFFTTKSEKSTGIGLTISKKIIEAHKGEISVESTQGKGTAFTISFPSYQTNALDKN
ncbi:MAG: response regulator [bacterium]|nr:response regulator [bacterium]